MDWSGLFSMAKFSELLSVIGKLFGAALIAYIGFFVRHYMAYKSRKHKFWGIELAIGLVVAILMGFVGSGLAEFFELGPRATVGLIAALGYIGPTIFDRIVDAAIKKIDDII